MRIKLMQRATITIRARTARAQAHALAAPEKTIKSGP